MSPVTAVIPVSTANPADTVNPMNTGSPEQSAPLASFIASLPMRLIGALLMVGALDPARWQLAVRPQWFVGAAAFIVGFWAAAPIIERPVMASHRIPHRIQRYRNTLVAAVAALIAACQVPPLWLMGVEVGLLFAYLALLDVATAAPRGPVTQLTQALFAGAASAGVLFAATASYDGGWRGRAVASLAVLCMMVILAAALRLRRPAKYVKPAPAKPSRRER